MTQNTAVVAIPRLGDPAVLADILMYSARDAVRVMMTDGNPDEYAEIVFGVSSIFMSRSDSLELPAGWDPKTAGAELRTRMEDVFAEMPEEDRETFADDESVLALAVMTCYQEAASLIEAWGETHHETDVDKILTGVLHDEIFAAHFQTWAEMILGRFAEKSAD